MYSKCIVNVLFYKPGLAWLGQARPGQAWPGLTMEIAKKHLFHKIPQISSHKLENEEIHGEFRKIPGKS